MVTYCISVHKQVWVRMPADNIGLRRVALSHIRLFGSRAVLVLQYAACQDEKTSLRFGNRFHPAQQISASPVPPALIFSSCAFNQIEYPFVRGDPVKPFPVISGSIASPYPGIRMAASEFGQGLQRHLCSIFLASPRCNGGPKCFAHAA